MLETHTGGCHCGAIRFEVDVDLTTAEVLDCNCSICAKKGFLHLIVDADAFRYSVDDDALATYQFNTKTAKHHFCRICGIHPFYIARSHPDGFDVNARALDDVDVDTLRVTRFDGKNWEANVDTIRD